MAIASDATTQADSSGFVNSMTVSHAGGSGSDRGVLVAVASREAQDITGITYAGTGMTLEAQALNTGTAGSDIWSLAAPSTGTQDAVLSSGSNYNLYSMFVETFTGVNQSDIVDATATGGTFSADTDTSITTVTNNSRIFTSCNWQGNAAITMAGGATETNDTDHSDSSLGRHGVAYEDDVTAGSESHGWTTVSSDNWRQAMVAIKPAAAASSTKRYTLSTLGVG